MPCHQRNSHHYYADYSHLNFLFAEEPALHFPPRKKKKSLQPFSSLNGFNSPWSQWKKPKFTLALHPHSTGECLTKLWNGYISLRSFVPNLHSKFHGAWENSPERV